MVCLVIQATIKTGRMIAGTPKWMDVSSTVNATGESFGGLGKAGLITVIVVSIIAIVALVWIFRETGRRD